MIEIINPAGTAERTNCYFTGSTMTSDASPEIRPFMCSGQYTAADAITGAQLLWSGGSTFQAAGDVTVYRRKRS